MFSFFVLAFQPFTICGGSYCKPYDCVLNYYRGIGLVGIGPKEEVDDEIEIAYYISEEYCNQGFISEAGSAMTEWVFNNTEVEYLIAIVELDNYPSQKVIEKCGFSKLETKMILNSGDTIVKPFFYYRLYKKEITISS